MKILEKLKNNSNLEDFIDKNFQEIYDFFHNQTQIELYSYKKEIKQYLRQAKKEILSLDCSNKINGDFLALLIDSCEKLHLFMEFGLLYDYLSKCGYKLGYKLQASHQYCNGIKKFNDYYDKNSLILELLENSYLNEDVSKEQLTVTYMNFYLHCLYNFGGNNQSATNKFREYISSQLKENTFLDKKFIKKIFKINLDNYKKAYQKSIKRLNKYLYKNGLITYSAYDIINSEVSPYSKKLYNLKNPTFDKIREVSNDYIMSIDNHDKLHPKLNHGVVIIEEQDLLDKYLHSYGKMHKAKLYSSFDEAISQLNNETINIIDWGCGQALATSLLIDYIKENSLNIDISNIILIEPSSLALSRGLLHISVLKENKIDIKAVNKDIDSLTSSDLVIDNQNITLHLFSNILDVEFFKLNKDFLDKISSSQKGLNYFICVSPNINDKRNARLDLFYRYFKDDFKTKLISNRDEPIGKYQRYEKIFKTDFKRLQS